MSDAVKYAQYLHANSERFEQLCTQCGECCGATDGDPCQHLKFDIRTHRFFCCDYDSRLGMQKTIKGNTFTCVTIREIIRDGALRANCGYQKLTGC